MIKDLICPYCGQIMVKGSIQSIDTLAFSEGAKKKLPGAGAKETDAVILSKFNLMSGSASLAYICKECKKIVIDYSELTDINKIKR